MDNLTWVVITILLQQLWKRVFSKGVPMLEGNEVEGQALDGAVKYAVDVSGDAGKIGKVAAFAEANLEKEIIPSIPGAMKVKLVGKVEIEGDPIVVAIAKLKDSTSPVGKFLAGQLAALRAGEEVHPAVAQAAAEAEQPKA